MTLKKLDSRGIVHWSMLIPVAVIAVVAAVGVRTFSASHAATLADATLSTSSGPTTTVFLNYADAAQTKGVTNVTNSVNSLGDQTVSSVSPGATLTYVAGGKGSPKNVCYYILLQPTVKGGSLTAIVAFASSNNVVTKRLVFSNTNTSTNYQKVCVGSGNLSYPGYNVANQSVSDGPNVLVYQAEENY